MDIIKPIKNIINGSEIAFFSFILQKNEDERIRATFTIIADPPEIAQEIRTHYAKALRRLADQVEKGTHMDGE